MLATIQGDNDTAAADPSHSPVLHGAGAEGTRQSCPLCPDVAHICGVHATWHRWVAQTRMGGQAWRMCSDLEGGGVPYLCPPPLRPRLPNFSALGSFPGRQAALVLPTACLSMTSLPSRAGRLPGAGAGGYGSLTTCVVGDTDRHQRM